MASENLCLSCTESRMCETWGDVKCLALKQRIYGYKKLTSCVFYKKRPKDFEEPACQCEDCLKNDKLYEEGEED